MKTATTMKPFRPFLATAAAAGLALTFTACGVGSPGGPDVVPEGEQVETGEAVDAPASEDPAVEDGSSAEESDGAAATGDETVIEIGETIEDPDMGDTIQIHSAVRDFQSDAESELIADGGEVLLLEVTVTPGDEYGGLVSMGGFKLSWDDGEDYWNNKTRMVEDDMEAADFPVLDDVSRRDGGDHTGWMAFLVDEKSESYLMRYERSGAEVIGSDEVIDRFREELEIPASQ